MTRGALGALALAATLAPGLAGAQLRVRSELGAALQPLRRLEVSLAQRLIVGDGIRDGGRWQTLVGAEWTFNRYVALGGGYRLWGEADWGGPELRHRFHLDATASLRWRALRVSWRLRGQVTLRDDNDGARADPLLRNRVAVHVRALPWLQLGAAGELFSSFTGDAPSALDRVRVEAEVRFRVRAVDLGLGYRWDAPLEGTRDETHSLMLSATWRWERRRERRAR